MSARRIIESASRFYDPSTLWLHGSRAKITHFRRYAKGGTDSGGLFFVKDTPAQERYAASYGDKLYRCRVALSPDEVFELPQQDHVDRVSEIRTDDAVGADMLRSAFSAQRFGHMDWTAVDEEVLLAAGFRACVLAERPQGFNGYSEDILSLCVFDPSAVTIVSG